MAAEASGPDLISVVVLLGAGVVAVPIFKRLGLGSVLGYLAAGLVIGPFGLRLFSDPMTILHVAELGVVMFLFIIGLEMQPSRLWGMRKEIFGLGALQVAGCALVLTAIGVATGFPVATSFVSGAGFVLTSTAIVMQILEERGDMASPAGQKMVSILLFEDLAIVPLLALVAFLAPISTEEAGGLRWMDIGIGLGAVAGLIIAGRYLLNPLFSILAVSRAREVMTAAALLVVLGAALLMQVSGLSMAMGAFLAGVLLSESTFRHQLEADIEPFRGILLGLFFLAVGMSLDLAVVAANWQMVIFYVIAFMLFKAAAIYVVARLLKTPHRESVERAVIMAQGGEFAFVLYATATNVGILDGQENAILTAIIIISMVLTPLAIIAMRAFLGTQKQSLDGVDVAENLSGRVLVIGFGRFGQIASQPLLLRGVDVSIIDNDVEMIQAAAQFGFKVYYGDGTRLDILHAAGAGRAQAVLVCVDKPETILTVVRLIKSEFPLLQIYARSYDRGNTLELINAGVEYQVRETFESALTFGERTLVGLGVDPDEAAEVIADIRRRDDERLDLQLAGGIYAGGDLMKGNAPVPGPLIKPKQTGRALSEETASVLPLALDTDR
ncbi:monovalent cation:proton antiporter-2 (CPA2) family protein [Phyllobacterium sp. 21LDTY02-6]|uniref:monovalent cation:proton antiporter-2 (CPA2) family protein n=1 Tax=unclassified Phyllobacterium TaxID=2638441 RepID=UPI00202062C7|nr:MULTISPECIES: monovalent cation:proton antiporter-2 (CPA2) family protein [unclassified Phyllobacterium]MCO4315714.1 monovalent cation:proton antiporter-2 (CPA2) family protein [Phyllobacterium sp. 21LDTY02-6]MCX8280874.1 monovalent cation:proton antiporter-2 (CPA2) family protein [Phyllobacterium sp. 0TCS1.6C]MCX8295740.1 monovalent cation:proton antiporter-2 (CPA2) family protein [Phyllobacterium sp. 0TCS1.6A]